MKNKNEQNRKFKNQVNHLSGFIGMPMWNGRKPSLSEIRALDRLVLEKQALGFEPERSSFFKRCPDSLVSMTSRVFRHCFVRINRHKKRTDSH